ncbi:hypothetical protein G432_09230 [Sphingomonas sp. MM-1]|uniref:lysylphosphatidylglycerol synthase domain-containing protein n=1 Tax=Sphingomonas sp. MM-1 TaxID=745310 RepID=UPI0002C13829|nr:lysylphosphatidylglycerol synthase domain-containing protein [Sphingomonas sp. MM-1]AGH49571.1 hypothetical protein G432_09230 [Sphingomonas sp. MM-1]
MKVPFRWPLLAATAIGLAIALWAIGRAGLGDIMAAAGRLGIGGFLLLIACSFAVLGLLGAAWLTAMPDAPFRRLPLFTWARTTREGASDLLPFSQIGGIVVGAWTLIGRGLPATRVYASIIVDLTTEMAAQLLFTLFGLWMLGAILLDADAMRSLRTLALIGAGVAVAVTIAFALLQVPALRFLAFLARRMLPRAEVAVDAVVAELTRYYRVRRAILASFFFNLLAWAGSAASAWLTLRLMGEHQTIWHIIALESLIFALRSAAFVVPGAIGIQEAGYILLGPIFGIGPEAAVALSLVKRARDIAIGVPALLIWQMGGVRSGLRKSA